MELRGWWELLGARGIQGSPLGERVGALGVVANQMLVDIHIPSYTDLLFVVPYVCIFLYA